MEKYKILRQGFLESNSKFDQRLNDMAAKGWKPISISSSHNSNTIVLMVSEREFNAY